MRILLPYECVCVYKCGKTKYIFLLLFNLFFLGVWSDDHQRLAQLRYSNSLNKIVGYKNKYNFYDSI